MMHDIDGFTIVVTDTPTDKSVKQKSDDIEVEVTLMADGHAYVSGHTRFKIASGKWLTFDRSGIEDSFYPTKYVAKSESNGYEGSVVVMTPSELHALVLEQIVKAKAFIERHKTMIDVPGLPFRLTPDRLAEHKQALKAGKHVTLLPGGMGTGYDLSTKKTSRYSRVAKPETARFFEVQTLYMDMIDHD